MFVQATVAILILVGFESVTSMGGEAKERQARRPDCGHHFAARAGRLLLSLRVLRCELLLSRLSSHLSEDGGTPIKTRHETVYPELVN